METKRGAYPTQTTKTKACPHSWVTWIQKRIVVIAAMIAEPDGWQVSLITPMEDIDGFWT